MGKTHFDHLMLFYFPNFKTEMEMVPWMRALFVSGSLGSEEGILSGRPKTYRMACIQLWTNWSADKNDPGYTKHGRDASYISYESAMI